MEIWDVVAEKLKITCRGPPTDWILCVSFTPDGVYVIGSGTNIYIWDLRTGALEATLKGHTAQVKSFAVSPDGHRLVSGSDDHTIKIWDFNLRSVDNGCKNSIQAVTFSEDGRLVASGHWNHTVSIWDMSTGLSRRLSTDRVCRVTCVVFSADGQLVIGGDCGGIVTVWNVTTGEQKASMEIGDGRDDATVHSSAISISQDGILVAFASEAFDFPTFSTQSWKAQWARCSQEPGVPFTVLHSPPVASAL